MTKRRISNDEIAVGQRLAWDVYDEEGRLLLRRGQVIDNSHKVEELVRRGLFTESDPIHSSWRKAEPPPERKTALSQIIEARRQLALICSEKMPKGHFPEQVTRIVMLIREACELSKDVALASILLHREGRYSIRHSVDAALVGHVVGTFTGMQDAELMSVSAAALTMNVSMLALQDHLQSNEPPLTPEQRQVIQHHPDESVELLRRYGVTDELWLQTVQDHHESIDGSGYPAQKRGESLLLPTRIVSLSDIYCARVSGRDYRAALRPNDALRAIFLGHGTSVETFLAAQFIKSLGVFPPGIPVRLSNGEIGVVIHHGEKANIPVVCSVISPSGIRLSIPIKRDTSIPLYSVREAAHLSDLGGAVSMQALWGKEGASS